jgi:hypothetical protein
MNEKEKLRSSHKPKTMTEHKITNKRSREVYERDWNVSRTILVLLTTRHNTFDCSNTFRTTEIYEVPKECIENTVVDGITFASVDASTIHRGPNCRYATTPRDKDIYRWLRTYIFPDDSDTESTEAESTKAEYTKAESTEAESTEAESTNKVPIMYSSEWTKGSSTLDLSAAQGKLLIIELSI